MKQLNIHAIVVRLSLALVVLSVSIYFLLPHAKNFLLDQNASAAAQKARSLKSIVQIAATEQLVAGHSHDETITYLTSKNNLSSFAQLSKFPIYANNISEISLDSDGLIDGMRCTIIYNDSLYDVSINSSTTKVIAIADGE